jgi:hypothetical protein
LRRYNTKKKAQLKERIPNVEFHINFLQLEVGEAEDSAFFIAGLVKIYAPNISVD